MMIGYPESTSVSLPNFLVSKFCGKAQFSHSFERFARNYAKTVPYRKTSAPENQVKIRYFTQCTKYASDSGTFSGTKRFLLNSFLLWQSFLFSICQMSATQDCKEMNYRQNRQNDYQTKSNHEGEPSIKNSCVLVITIFKQSGVKKQHDRVSFLVLYPTIHSNKSFNELKTYSK